MSEKRMKFKYSKENMKKVANVKNRIFENEKNVEYPLSRIFKGCLYKFRQNIEYTKDPERYALEVVKYYKENPVKRSRRFLTMRLDKDEIEFLNDFSKRIKIEWVKKFPNTIYPKKTDLINYIITKHIEDIEKKIYLDD